MPLVLIAPQPVLIQNEPSYADAVEADGHSFLFQINEEGGGRWLPSPTPIS